MTSSARSTDACRESGRRRAKRIAKRVWNAGSEWKPYGLRWTKGTFRISKPSSAAATRNKDAKMKQKAAVNLHSNMHTRGAIALAPPDYDPTSSK